MPLYIPATFYEAAFHHSLTGSLHDSVCTIGWEYSGVDFANDANGLAVAWGANIVQSMADVWTYREATLRDASGTVYDNPGFAVGGGTAHTATTPNVTFLLKKNTGFGGRSKRGRLYLPGVSEQDVDQVGTVVGSKLTELSANWSGFITAAAAANFAPVLLHNSTSANPTPAPTSITSFTWETLAATQRRRMRK